MKKTIALFSFAILMCLTTLAMTSCENLKHAGGNEMMEGSRTYNYAYVCSQVTGNKYYHISGWKEYGPEGGSYTSTYVGLELQLAVSKDVVYYWEPNLMYVLTKNRDANYGIPID